MKDYMKDWVEVIRIDTGGWDWSTMEVYYSPGARQYFWLSQSGCSCYMWETPESVGEWFVGDKKTALDAVNSFEGYGGRSGRDKIVDAIKVRDFDE